MSPTTTPAWGPSRGWWGVTLSLMMVLLAQPLSQGHLSDGLWRSNMDWQPNLAWSQPWRWWTPVAVHLSVQHLLTNATGVVLVGSLGWAARLPRQAAWAWCMAWPLTHLGLLLRPELLRYGGASGVLHAGVAVTATWLVFWQCGKLRRIGALTGLILVLKVLSETPWGPVLQTREGWDIVIAPLAHATGALAGGVCGLLFSAMLQRQRVKSGEPLDQCK